MFSIIFRGPRVILAMVFSVAFQASTGKKLWEKITEKIMGPVSLMLNILLCMYQSMLWKYIFQTKSHNKDAPS